MANGTYAAESSQQLLNSQGSGIYSDRQRDYYEAQSSEIAADNAYKRQEDFFNAYQSPSAQIKLLKEAGMSPSIFTSGGLSGGSGTSGVSGSGGGGNTGGTQAILGVMSAIKDISLMGAEISKTKAEKDLIKAQTKETLTRSDYNEENTLLTKSRTSAQNLQNLVSEKYSMRQALATLTLTENQAQEAYWNAKNANWTFDFNNETKQHQVQALINNNALTYTNALKNASDIQLNNKQIERIDNEWKQWCTENWLKYIELTQQEYHYNNEAEWLQRQHEQFYDKLYQDKVITEEQYKILKQGQWLQFGSEMFKTISYTAAMYFAGPAAPIIGNMMQPAAPQIGFR